MATKTVVELVDDIDGSTEDVETVRFGWDNQDFEIDLGTKTRTALSETMAEYVPYARKVQVKPGRGPKPGKGPKPDRAQTRAIRDWARAHGFTVSDRGRVPGEVLEAYHKSA